MEVVLVIAGLMLVIAAGLALVRIVRGPGASDRIVATDVLITTVAGGLAVEAAINHQPHTIPVILVVSLLAFAGTVAMARFVAGREGVVGTGPGAGLEGEGAGSGAEGEGLAPGPAREEEGR